MVQDTCKGYEGGTRHLQGVRRHNDLQDTFLVGLKRDNDMSKSPVFHAFYLYWYPGLKRDNDVSKSHFHSFHLYWYFGLKRDHDVSKSPVFMPFTFLVFWLEERPQCVQIPCFMPFTFMVFWFEKGPWCVQIPCFHSFHLTAILDWKETMMCPNPLFSCLLPYWYFGLKRDNDVSKSPVFMPFTFGTCTIMTLQAWSNDPYKIRCPSPFLHLHLHGCQADLFHMPVKALVAVKWETSHSMSECSTNWAMPAWHTQPISCLLTISLSAIQT